MFLLAKVPVFCFIRLLTQQRNLFQEFLLCMEPGVYPENQIQTQLMIEDMLPKWYEYIQREQRKAGLILPRISWKGIPNWSCLVWAVIEPLLEKEGQSNREKALHRKPSRQEGSDDAEVLEVTPRASVRSSFRCRTKSTGSCCAHSCENHRRLCI